MFSGESDLSQALEKVSLKLYFFYKPSCMDTFVNIHDKRPASVFSNGPYTAVSKGCIA